MSAGPGPAAKVEELLNAHLEIQADELFARSRRDFLETGLGLAPFLLPDEAKKLISVEVDLLVDERSAYRNMQLRETGNSWRRMRNVGATDIKRHDGWIAALYNSPAFRKALSRVAGEPVLECPYEPERYVITRLERAGDTHGWHWDDYSFGVVFVVECPPVKSGGFVQCVPGTRWDKKNPQVFQKIIDYPIRSYALRTGDLYLLRTDTTMHQVHPILEGRRTIVNFAYAAHRDATKNITHETMEELFRDHHVAEG
jgi:hypothetical protein